MLYLGNAQVAYSGTIISRQQDVLRFDIVVKDSVVVQFLQSCAAAG